MDNLNWLSHPIVALLGFVSTLITIFVFMTGKASIWDVFKDVRSHLGLVLLAVLATVMIMLSFPNLPDPLHEPTPTSAPPVSTPITVAQNTDGATSTATSAPDLPSPTPVVEVVTPVPPTTTNPPPPTFTNAPTPCEVTIDSDIQVYWSSDMGCAIEPAHITWASFTPFQKGFMMWRDDTRKIYGFFDRIGWNEDEDRFREGMPDRPTPNRGDPPPGLFAPIRGTGLVWETNDKFFNNLGWARVQQKGFCAKVQNFTGGFIVRDSGNGS